MLIIPDCHSLAFPLPGREIDRRKTQLSRPLRGNGLRTPNGLVRKARLISKGKLLLNELPLAARGEGQSCSSIISSSDSLMMMLGRYTLKIILTVIFVIHVSDAPVITLSGGATSVPWLRDLFLLSLADKAWNQIRRITFIFAGRDAIASKSKTGYGSIRTRFCLGSRRRPKVPAASTPARPVFAPTSSSGCDAREHPGFFQVDSLLHTLRAEWLPRGIVYISSASQRLRGAKLYAAQP